MEASASTASSADSTVDPEQAETERLVKLKNREVLRSELSDARHRSTSNERVRWLEAELNMASNKAKMARRGARDRIRPHPVPRARASFLELANRYRERLGEQHALQRLKAREKALTQRLATLEPSTRSLGTMCLVYCSSIASCKEFCKNNKDAHAYLCGSCVCVKFAKVRTVWTSLVCLCSEK